MKKINLRTRDNMTFLAKAYMDRILPCAKSGEVFYERDLKTESAIVYFESGYYDNTLLVELNNSQTISSMRNSNAGRQWLELVSVLKDFEDVEDINIGILVPYSIVDENFSVIRYNEEKLNSILNNSPTEILFSSIKQDLQNIFPSLDLSVFQQDGILMTTFGVPIKEDLEQRFDFYPIVKILEKHNQVIKTIKLFKGKEENLIYFTVIFDSSNS